MNVRELIEKLESAAEVLGDPVVLIPGYANEGLEDLTYVQLAAVRVPPSITELQRYGVRSSDTLRPGKLITAIVLKP
jgi:hypothetical protein